MRRAILAASVVMLSFAGVAMAQEAADPAPQVLSNQFPLPPVAEPGRRLRSADRSEERLGIGHPPLRLFSQVEVGAVVTSNADRSAGGAKNDFGLLVAPELRLQSNWSRHEVRVSAVGEGAYFAKSGELDIDTLGVNGSLRLDIRRTTKLDLDAAYGATRASVTSKKLDQQFSGGAALTHDFGAVETSLRAGGLMFMPGEEDVAPYVEPSLALRNTLNTHGGFRPFVEGTYSPRIIKGERDSQGGSLAAGITFEREPFVTGELAAVYTFQESEDLTQAFGVRGSVSWTPTDFTAIGISSNVEIEEEGRKQWTGAVDINHQLTDDISVFAGGGGTVTSIKNEKDTISLESNAGVAWTWNENLAWSLRYENLFVLGEDKTSEHRAIAGVILRR